MKKLLLILLTSHFPPRLLLTILLAGGSLLTSFSQNNALVLNGAYITLNGGTSATPIYLVVAQTNTLGITRPGGGHIISEGDYNFVKWNEGAATGSYVYPFGYSTTDYLPLTFNKTGGDANLAMSTYYPTTNANANLPLANGVLNMFSSGPGSDASNLVVDRWWRMQVENGATAPTADLTFSYRGTENSIIGINCPTDLIVPQYWNSLNWVTPAMLPGSACTTSGVGTSQANGVAVFTTTSSQPFVLVKKTGILPVELLSFSANCDNKKVIVKWSTATEINNDFFTVERSPDALNYQPIGFVNGAGNSSAILNYSFTDTDPLSGTSYYRLKQTDFNGMTETFSSSSLSSCGNGGLNVVIGQNPTIDGDIWVSISGAENNNLRVSVTDILGQNLYTKNLTGITGSYLLNAELQLAGGIYIVSASTSDEVFSKKIVVVR